MQRTALLLLLFCGPLACESTLTVGTYDVAPGVGATDCTNSGLPPPASVWEIKASGFNYTAAIDSLFSLQGTETEDENSIPVINLAGSGTETVNGCVYTHSVSVQLNPQSPGATTFLGYYEDDVVDCNNQACSENYPISGARRP